jgi:uncharacterized protein (TIGR03067 family)
VRTIDTLLVGIIWVASGAWASGQDASKPNGALEGGWITISAEKDGKEESFGTNRFPRVIFEGQYLAWETVQLSGRACPACLLRYRFRVDTDSSPYRIAIYDTKQPGSTPRLGIVQWRDDDLWICLRESRDGTIPTEFAARPGSQDYLIKLRRESP